MRLISVGWKDRDSQDVNPGLETGHVAAYAEKLMSGRGGGMDHEMRDAWWAIRVGGPPLVCTLDAWLRWKYTKPVGAVSRCCARWRCEGGERVCAESWRRAGSSRAWGAVCAALST